MHRNFRLLYVFLLFTILFLFACKKNLNKVSLAKWKPEVTLPFIQTELKLSDILPQDSNLNTLPDSSLYYTYHKSSIFSLNADSILNMFDNSLDTLYNFSLGELKVDTFNIIANYSLNDALPYLDENVKDTLLAHNQSENIFPPFNYSVPFSISTEPVNFYESLTFSQGYIQISVTNSLPVVLNQIIFSVKDDVNNIILKNISIETLAAGESFYDTLYLKGLTLGNRFSFIISNFTSDGSYPDSVYIDLNQGLNFDFKARNLQVIKGKSKIPQQIMFSSSETINFSADNGEKLYQLIFASGKLNYFIQSELHVRVYIELKLPTGLVNGVIPHADIVLPANGAYEDSWNLDNTLLNLNTDTAKPYNRFPVFLGIMILPTDELVTFDSSDNVLTRFSTELLKPAYAKGYFGKKVFNINTDTISINLNFLQRLQGKIILNNPVMKLTYHNGFGIPMKILPQFEAFNTNSGDYVELNLDSIALKYPQNAGDYETSMLQIDKTNSEIVNFMAIRPDEIVLSGGGISNWNDDTLNFIYDTSTLKSDIDVNIPLVLRSDNLQLSDTLQLTANNNGIDIYNAAFKVLIQNGFPFTMHLYLQLNDSTSGNILYTLDIGKIVAAPVNNEGKVIHSVSDSLLINLDNAFFDKLKLANRGIFLAKSSTFSGGSTPVGLFSNYKLKIAIGFTAAFKP